MATPADARSGIEPALSPPPALGPPIIGTDTPGSAPGIVQPQYKSGSATSPATPISITGTPILPPPQVGFGNNAPASPQAIKPAPVPPSVAGYPQPQYATGSATVPTAASLFPEFSTTTPSPPIVFANIAQIGTTPPPSTPTTAPIILDGWTWGAYPTGPLINLSLPDISGSTVVGHVLTCSTGAWEGDPTSFKYQWYGPNGNLGTNSPTYTTVSSDIGHDVACTVTATNAIPVSASATSAPYGPITATTRDVNVNLDPDLPPRPHDPSTATHKPAPRNKRR